MEWNKDTIYELIEDYLENRLTAVEMEQVRQQIQKDAGFAKEVEWMQTLLSLNRRKAEYAMLQNFRAFHRRQNNIRQLHTIRRWSVAAAAILCILTGWWCYERHTSQSTLTKNLQTADSVETNPVSSPIGSLNQTIEPLTTAPSQGHKHPTATLETGPQKTLTPNNTPAVKKTALSTAWEQLIASNDGLQTLGDEDHSNLSKALRLMDDGKRKEALPFLEAYLSKLSAGEEDYEMRIEAGKIYLKDLKDFDKATFHFQKVLNSEALPLFKDEASYYLALNEYASGNVANARKKFETLQKQGSTPWNTKAKTAISKLFR
jgi:tetratricopeptide (TPR) repeat protein